MGVFCVLPISAVGCQAGYRHCNSIVLVVKGFDWCIFNQPEHHVDDSPLIALPVARDRSLNFLWTKLIDDTASSFGEVEQCAAGLGHAHSCLYVCIKKERLNRERVGFIGFKKRRKLLPKTIESIRERLRPISFNTTRMNKQLASVLVLHDRHPQPVIPRIYRNHAHTTPHR